MAAIAVLAPLLTRYRQRRADGPFQYSSFPGRYQFCFREGEVPLDEKYQTTFSRLGDRYIYRRFFPETYTLVEYTEYTDEKLSLRHGPYRRYHDNGTLAESGTYRNDEPVGQWETFDASGQPTVDFGRTGKERADPPVPKEADQPITPAGPATGVFEVKEELPLFPGCAARKSYAERKSCADRALITWIQRNIRYPERARRLGVQGKAMVSFRITDCGKVDRIQVVEGLNTDISRELVRLVSAMPDWEPGRQNGKPVHVQFNLPVVFSP